MPRKLKIQWDERKKLIAYASACAALFLLAALLPLAFRSEGKKQNPEEDRVEENKAALFASYWYGSASGVELEKVSPGGRTADFCEDRMAELVERCINDLGVETYDGPAGSEYTVLTGENAELRLCRMWYQVRGDWQNWLDVCIDADTGDIYYFYLSRECLTNGRLYTVPAAERPTVESLAAGIAEERDCRLRYVQINAAGTGTAFLNAGDGTLCYEISCAFYSGLIDIRISCV